MRTLAIPLLLAAAASAAPKTVECVKTAEEAVKIARTRGKLILLTVIIDGDGENRMVVDQVFRDRAFRKIADEFVLLYANKDNEHGQVMVKGPDGKRVPRCADCPSLECTDHMFLAMSYARGFYPDSNCRTPVHFVLNAKEEVVEVIKNGTFEQGFSHVPAKQVVAALKKLLDKYGRGLTEKEYEEIRKHMVDAKAARARDNVTLELEHLNRVVAVDKEVEYVLAAKKRIQEIDKLAARELKDVDELVAAKKWEQALDWLMKFEETYPGTLSAAAADQKLKELQGERDVKRLLKARDMYEAAMKFKERKRFDLARARFEKCVRIYPNTKYGELSKKELEALPPG
jgi:hypothetical protein